MCKEIMEKIILLFEYLCTIMQITVQVLFIRAVRRDFETIIEIQKNASRFSEISFRIKERVFLDAFRNTFLTPFVVFFVITVLPLRGYIILRNFHVRLLRFCIPQKPSHQGVTKRCRLSCCPRI
jgi:hypothetical protein